MTPNPAPDTQAALPSTTRGLGQHFTSLKKKRANKMNRAHSKSGAIEQGQFEDAALFNISSMTLRLQEI